MHAQLDYLYFISGCAFLLAAASAFKASRADIGSRALWRRLGFVGSALGLHDWCDVPARHADRFRTAWKTTRAQA
jgi:hypothetical protein